MRTAIILFAIALCISCLTGGYAGSPAAMKMGVSDVKQGSAGGCRQEGLVGEVKIIDGYRPYLRPESVTDKASSDHLDFPQMGRFH